ncbi:MAG: TapB family protein, partial [Melioribacteraceae bacterium]
PLPLNLGVEWKWEGDEYSDGDTNKVKVTGKAFDKEFVMTKAGRFEAIKLESIIEGSANAKNRVTEWFAEGIGLIKAKIIIEGGGVMGFLRDLLGYGTIEFELKEIRKQ